jgi:hypothetical protein
MILGGVSGRVAQVEREHIGIEQQTAFQRLHNEPLMRWYALT